MQLVLAVAGAAIGSAIGGVTGAQIGWAAGSIGGALLFPPTRNSEGPRLQSLTVSASSYGIALPQVIGTAPVGGNVIWAAPIKETRHDHEVGKGGGGRYTTYTYSCSFMVAICEGPIVGVRRIWANEKLIYDQSADALPAEIVGSQAVADNIRILTGSTTQMPSALIESFEGAGNVPGYRGTALAEFTDFELTPYGNALPNLKFEVVADGALTAPSLIRTYTHWDKSSGTSAATLTQPQAARLAGKGIIVQQADLSLPAKTISRAVVDATADAVTLNAYSIAGYEPIGWTLIGFGGSGVRNDADLAMSEIRQYDQFGVQTARVAYFQVTDPNHAADFAGATADPTLLPPGYRLGGSTGMDTGPFVSLVLADGKKYVFQSPTFGSTRNDSILLARSGARSIDASDGLDYFGYCPLPVGVGDAGTGTVGVSTAYVAADAENRWIVATTDNATTNRLYVVDAETMAIRAIYDGIATGTHGGLVWPIAASAGRIAGLTSDTGVWYLGVYDASGTGGTVASPLTLTEVGTTRLALAESNPLDNSAVPGSGLVIIGSSLYRYTDALTPNAVTLETLVERICTAAGYGAGEVDATDLASISVPGYVRNQRMTGAAQLQLLSAAYGFDAAEVDAKVVSRRRGATAVATLRADDLLAVDGGAALAAARAQETELPRQIDVSYMSLGGDYTVGSQSAQRIASGSQQQTSVDLPLVLADADAAAMAARMLWEGWIGRTTRSFAVGPKWSALVPTDVVTLPLQDGASAATVRLTATRRDGMRIHCEAVDVDVAAFTQPGIAGAVNGPGSQSLAAAATAVEPVDLPSLRDTDDGYGLYVAASSLDSDWPGAVIYLEPAAGVDPVGAASTRARATMGQAATVLADSASGDGQIDLVSSVEVDVLYGTLPASISTTALLTGTANTWMIGDEVVQARTVETVAGTRIRLRELVRALRGTRAARATHRLGERAVQLDTALTDAAYPQGWVGNTVAVVGVTAGQRYSTGTRRYATLAGARLRPLPPANVRGVVLPNGDVFLQWHRRARLYSSWQGLADVPLDESSELYKVEICSGAGAVLRTVTGLTSGQLTYTAAQRTADFGTLENPTLRLRVYQISARVGDGMPADNTITLLGLPSQVLLMHFNGTNGSGTFTDSSAYARAISTVGGGVTNSNAQSKFGGLSGFFNVTSSGQYLQIAESPLLCFGLDDFTIDFWVYRTTQQYEQCVIAHTKANRTGFANDGHWLIESQGGDQKKPRFRFRSGGTVNYHTFANDLPLSAWTHIAVTRRGTTLRGFMNGVTQFKDEVNYNFVATTDPIFLGTYADGVIGITQYVDELRILNGVCAWASDFTPPAAAYT